MVRNRLAAALLASGIAAVSFADTSWADEAKGVVYVLLPNATTVRFTKFDEPYLKEAFAKYAPDIEVRFLNANEKASEQLSQMDAALASGAKGVVLMAVDPSQAGGMLAKAAQDQVPVVTYAHDPGPGPVAYHVTVDLVQIGAAQGKFLVDNLPEKRPVNLALMFGDPKFKFYHDQVQGFDSAIQPLVDSGEIKIVCKADALGYLPANAQKNMEQCLTQQNNEVDGVVVMNDDTAGGVIAALTAQGIREKVKVYGGYDATLEGIQRVLAGWQGATMSPPYRAMADSAAKLLVLAIKGESPAEGVVNYQWKNAFTQADVPARVDENILITADNVQQTVIDAGLYTKEEVCQGLAVDSSFCKAE